MRKRGFVITSKGGTIDVKCAEWSRQPEEREADMRKYLRPETLFSPKFEGYLNQAPPQELYQPLAPPSWVGKDDPSVEEILGVDFGDGGSP